MRIGAHNMEILSYSFFYIFATGIVVFGGWWYSRRGGFAHREIAWMILIMSISGLVGARIMHALTNSTLYITGDANLFALHMSNFAITGGIIGGAFSGIIVGKILRIDLWQFADRLMPFLGIGIGVARIGCFLNGCCFGHVTPMVWGVHFPLLSQAHMYQLMHGTGSLFKVMAVHPTQLYEMLGALFGGIMAFILVQKKFPSGIAVGVFGAWFAAVRFFNMQLRTYPDSLDVHVWFYPLLYMVVFVSCCAIIYRGWNRRQVT
jgi:phosphatidylglycerol:prolipoprotein diacylglycerol transferase